MYKYLDGCTHTGLYASNRAHGQGRSMYPTANMKLNIGSDGNNGSEYDGEWKSGRFDGKGYMRTAVGTTYNGQLRQGKRHGYGSITYPCGLEYSGEFLDGKVHGRGVMKSKLTGYTYDGTFERGSICGSGTLITPDNEAIVRFWPEATELRTLPGIIRLYLQEKEDEKIRVQDQRDEYFNVIRGRRLREYVTTVRTALHSERLEEKKKRYNEALSKLKDQKEKLYQARLRALADDDN